jgi:putative FmdB family regulatory protein
MPKMLASVRPATGSRLWLEHAAGAGTILKSRARAQIPAACKLASPYAAKGDPEKTMPIYEFECPACSERFDRLQKLSDPDPDTCPNCGATGVRRRLTAPAFRLAGSGWYETDFKKDGDRKRNLAEKSEPAKAEGKTSDTTQKSDSAKAADSSTKKDKKPASDPKPAKATSKTDS